MSKVRGFPTVVHFDGKEATRCTRELAPRKPSWRLQKVCRRRKKQDTRRSYSQTGQCHSERYGHVSPDQVWALCPVHAGLPKIRQLGGRALSQPYRRYSRRNLESGTLSGTWCQRFPDRARVSEWKSHHVRGSTITRSSSGDRQKDVRRDDGRGGIHERRHGSKYSHPEQKGTA